ncbi:hypothetical protein V6N13_019011 [Hibiscus sabdariffa]
MHQSTLEPVCTTLGQPDPTLSSPVRSPEPRVEKKNTLSRLKHSGEDDGSKKLRRPKGFKLYKGRRRTMGTISSYHFDLDEERKCTDSAEHDNRKDDLRLAKGKNLRGRRLGL